jgi:hypothetical protein
MSALYCTVLACDGGGKQGALAWMVVALSAIAVVLLLWVEVRVDRR